MTWHVKVIIEVSCVQSNISFDSKSSLPEEARLLLLEDIQSAISTVPNEDLPLPKISNDILSASNATDSMHYFYTSQKIEESVDKTSSNCIIDSVSLLDTVNFNSITTTKSNIDNLDIKSIKREIDDLDLFSNDTISTAVPMNESNNKTEECNVDKDNNVILVANTQSVNKMADFGVCNENLDFGMLDDFNGNAFTISELPLNTDQNRNENEIQEVDSILSFEEIENKICDSSQSFHDMLLPFSDAVNNIHIFETSVTQKKSETIESKKLNDDSKNILSPRASSKTMHKKRQVEHPSKPIDSFLKNQTALPEKLYTNTKKTDSPLKMESPISKMQERVSVKNGHSPKKVNEVNRQKQEDLIKRLSTVPKMHDVQSNNTVVLEKHDVQSKHDVPKKKHDVQSNDGEVPKKKNGLSQRTMSPSDRIQSPKNHNLNSLFTKVHTSRIQQEIKNSSSRRVHSAGGERQIRTSTKTQTSATSSPVSKDHSDFGNAAAIKKAVFDEWCRRKVEEKKKLLKQQQKEKEIQEKKKKEEEQKRMDSEQSFLSWKKHKENYIRKKTYAQKLEESSKRQEEVEKKVDAEMAMQSWKKIKDGKLVKDKKETKKHELDKIRLEKEEKERDKQDAQSAFEAWKAQKDAEIKKKIELKRKQEEEELKKQNEKLQKELEALRAYEEWLDQKDKVKRKGKKERHLLEQQQNSPTWSPPGKTFLVTHSRQKRCVS